MIRKHRLSSWRGATAAALFVTAISGMPTPAAAQLEPCAYAVCLAGVMQTPSGVIKGGLECCDLLCGPAGYFNLRIYSPHYNAPATMAARYARYLSMCPSTQIDAQVSSTFGMMFILPSCATCAAQ